MTPPQIVTLAVLTLVIAALIWDKVRADIVAMAGAAVLLVSGAIRPADAQGAFGSPAVIMVTAIDERDSLMQAVKLGVTDYIVKPFEPERVIMAVTGAVPRSDDIGVLAALEIAPQSKEQTAQQQEV